MRLALGLIVLLASLVLGHGPAVTGTHKAIIYKGPQCGCCNGYVAYLVEHGFDVVATNTDDVESIKDMYGIPDYLRSCHTMLIGKYVLEGHVPIAAIDRLLSQQLDITGIALPGMPAGSPGMGGQKTESLVIYVISYTAVEPFMVL